MNSFAQENKNIIESDTLEIAEKELSTELEACFANFSFLEEERRGIGNPDSMGKTVLDEVWRQFSNQIGLDATNETLIQQYNREHTETYDEVKDKVMQDPAYREANNDMKKQQAAGELKDQYTGKDIARNEQANLDHTVSRKEIHENLRRRQAGIDTKDLANKKENLNPTNENLNKSKSDKSVDAYLAAQKTRIKDLQEQNKRANEKINNDPNLSAAEKKARIEKINKALHNKLDVDPTLLKKADKKARNAINKKIAIGVAKSTAKKAGKDALKAMAVSALFTMLKEVMNGFVRWLRSAAKTFDRLLDEMKTTLISFFTKLREVFNVGVSSAIGTIVSEIFGPIVSTFKKMASFIKQGSMSFIDAIRYLTNKENKDKPFGIKVAQVGKIVTGCLVGGSAISLGEVFEKYLISVPGMQLPIPLLGTLANVIGLFLGSLVAGLIGAIAMNLIDKFIANQLKAEKTREIIAKQNEIAGIQSRQIQIAIAKVDVTKEKVANDIVARHGDAARHMDDADDVIAFNININSTGKDIVITKNDDDIQQMQRTLENLI